MSTWDDYKLTCCHGITEGLDDHPCEKCRALTDQRYGKDYPTVLFMNNTFHCLSRREPEMKSNLAERDV